MESSKALVVFQGKMVRRAWHQGQWHFVVVDVVAALTDSPDAADYLKKVRSRDESLNQGWGQLVTPLRVDTEGGPQLLNCANTEGVFRIIQSIPSKKAEPFKRWLAKVPLTAAVLKVCAGPQENMNYKIPYRNIIITY